MEGPFALASLRVRRARWAFRKRRAYHLPAGIGAALLLDGEDAVAPLGARLGPTEADTAGSFHYYRVEQRIDGGWVGATMEDVPLPTVAAQASTKR